MNPELRHTLNTVTRNLESANQVAQENIYTFTQLYIDPCLSGLKACVNDYTQPCFGDRDERARRKRGRSRGRAELNFDFYDDWDDDADAGNSLGGWGNDELDSLLAGNKIGRDGQPQQQEAMSYGSRGRPRHSALRGEQDREPTLIPKPNYLSFLDRLPFQLGTRPVRYQPSSADLQENPGGMRVRDHETQHLMEGSEDASDNDRLGRHRRQRRGTVASQSTTNSLSSRGDLIPSDEEDDAVPLDDEFAVELSKRTTNTGEEQSSGKSSRRSGTFRNSTRTSSRSIKSPKSQRSSSRKSNEPVSPGLMEEVEAPTIQDLQQEEQSLRVEEELEIEQKRKTAQNAAIARGLSTPEIREPVEEVKPDLDPSSPEHITISSNDVPGQQLESSDIADDEARIRPNQARTKPP